MPWDFFIKDNLYLYLRPGPLFGNTDVLTALDLPHSARLDSLGVTAIYNSPSYQPLCCKIIKTNIRTGIQQTVEYGFVNSMGGTGVFYRSDACTEVIDNQHYYYSIVCTVPFANANNFYLIGVYVQYSTTML
jgi:hypothetical protein